MSNFKSNFKRVITIKRGRAMKKLILTALLLLVPVIVSAAPFMVCDPQAGITTYKLTGPAWVPATVVAQADGSIKMDLASAAIGVTSLTVSACLAFDPLWPDERCSVPATPFSFTRPASPVTPKNIKLAP